MIHVKTSGLVFLKNLGVAATDQDLEFRFGGMTGHARGAEYNSDTGILILQSDVKTNGLLHERPAVLTASHAELDRQSRRALLTEATYVTPGQSVRSDHAIVHLRSEGAPERIEAEGHVVLESRTAGTITAPHGEVLLNQAGQAQQAHLFRGISYENVTALREGRGQAEDAHMVFGGTGRPQTIVLTGAVHVNDRVRAPNAGTSPAVNSPWTERDATAGRMTFAFAQNGDAQNPELRDVEATTSAHLTLVTDASTASAARSKIAGDSLRAAFARAGKVAQISTVHGAGQTSLDRVSARGAEETSSGDLLDVIFRPIARQFQKNPGTRTGSEQGIEQIDRAVQSGHVVLSSTPAPRSGGTAPSTTRATAELAVYDGDADHLTLTGRAQIIENASTVSANTIIMEHASGDATAAGMVKANYAPSHDAPSPGAQPSDTQPSDTQPDRAEPVHILADHAALQHDVHRLIFYGGAARPARLWQGASQVEAPVLELDQQERTLTAHGDAAGTGAPSVHAVLVSTAKTASSVPSNASRAGSSPSSVVRLASRTMVYLDQARRVEFSGDVNVEDADGVVRAQQATAYLQSASAPGSPASKSDRPRGPSKSATSGLFFGGGVERIVANGRIEVTQPGRRATGEQLTYTASDSMFVLTGTSAVPPSLIDEAQGTITGTSLRFHTADESVQIVGGGLTDSSRRVHTVTRVKQK